MTARGSILPKRVNVVAWLGVASGLIALLFSLGMPRWEIWDVFRPREPMDELVLVSARLRNDTHGIYTSEIRSELARRGWRYRSIDRAFPRRGIVTPSAQNSPSTRLKAQGVLDVHGGDVFVYGEVGLRDTVRIELYIPSDVASCCSTLELNLASPKWGDVLMEEIEALAFDAVARPLVDGPPSSTSVTLEAFLEFTARKLRELSDLAVDSDLRDRSSEASDYARTMQAKLEHDVPTIRALRQRLQREVANYPESDPYGVSLKLRIADLYMYEGMIEDRPNVVEQGLQVALEPPEETLQIEQDRVDVVVQPLSRANDADLVLITSLILACGDHAMMQRMMDLIIERDTCETTWGTADCKEETLQMLAGLNLHVVLEEMGELEWGTEALESLVDAGYSDWWNPVLQSVRLGQRKLREGDPRRSTDSTDAYCPSLSEWMSRKGWHELIVEGDERRED